MRIVYWHIVKLIMTVSVVGAKTIKAVFPISDGFFVLLSSDNNTCYIAFAE